VNLRTVLRTDQESSHVNRIHVPSCCAYEELRAAGDSEIPGPYRHFKKNPPVRCQPMWHGMNRSGVYNLILYGTAVHGYKYDRFSSLVTWYYIRRWYSSLVFVHVFVPTGAANLGISDIELGILYNPATSRRRTLTSTDYSNSIPTPGTRVFQGMY
jgi:hypothetical protein